MANNYSNQNSEMNDLVARVELLRIMECPVCQEIPFPPIYLCTRGHNICKNCKTKLKECPTCRGPLSETRNFTVEQLVLASNHSCSYKEDGCCAELRGELMENHMKDCSYRPFKCPWFGQSKSIDSLRLADAKEHILKVHLAMSMSEGQTRTVYGSLPFNLVTGEGSQRRWKNPKLVWNPIPIEFDGRVFLLHKFAMGKNMCFSALCVGSEEDVQKYRAKIICQPDKEFEIQWTVPVNSILMGAELMKPQTQHSVFIASCTLDNLIQMAEIDEDKLGYRFRTRYTIFKK